MKVLKSWTNNADDLVDFKYIFRLEAKIKIQKIIESN